MSVSAVRWSAIVVTAGFLIGAASAAAFQGGNPAELQERVAALKEAMAKSQTSLKAYTWTETTEVLLKGEVKKTTRKLCHYGPDGKVATTEMPGAEPAQPQSAAGGHRRGGGLKQAIVQKKVAEIKDYMERVRSLVHEYAPPNKERIQAAVTSGNASLNKEQGGVAELAFRNYYKQGDLLSLVFDSQKKAIQSYNVNSYLNKPKEDDVTLHVTFASLPDGTNHVEQSILNAAVKDIEVRVTNSAYTKSGQ